MYAKITFLVRVAANDSEQVRDIFDRVERKIMMDSNVASVMVVSQE